MRASSRRAMVALITSAVACVGRPSPREERAVLAYVSGTPIYRDDFDRHLRRIKVDTDRGLPSVAGEQAQRRALLDDLIERHLLLREAERHNVVVGMSEVEAAYQRTRNGWPAEDFEQLLKERDLTPAELKGDLREQLMIQKYFRDHVFSRVAVTDPEIEAYLEAHPEEQIEMEQVRARQIVVKTEEEAKAIAQELKRGLSFEDAAMKYSLSPEGKNGGDLGFFSRGVMPAVFDEASFSLRPGEVSDVLRSSYGFHLFKVVERREQREVPLREAREKIEIRLRREKEHAAQRRKTDALRKAAKIEIREERLAQTH